MVGVEERHRRRMHALGNRQAVGVCNGDRLIVCVVQQIRCVGCHRRATDLRECEHVLPLVVNRGQRFSSLVSFAAFRQCPVERQIGGHPACGERTVVGGDIGLESLRHPVVVRAFFVVVLVGDAGVVVDVEVVAVRRSSFVVMML